MNTLERDAGLVSRSWLRVARPAWLVVAVLSALFILVHYRQAVQVFASGANFAALAGDPDNARAGFASLGWSPSVLGIVSLAARTAAICVLIASAAFLYWVRSREWVALVMALAFVMFAPGLIGGFIELSPAWAMVSSGLSDFGWITVFAVFLLFPDGRFVPGWSKWLLPFWYAPLLGIVLPGSFLNADRWPATINLVFLSTVILAPAAGQVYRYLRVSEPRERQQTKWVVFVGTVAAGIVLLVHLLPAALPGLHQPGVTAALYELFSEVAGVLTTPLVCLAIIVAILRFHLWDIDVIIRKTLIYTALTVLLALVYFGSVVLLQQLFGAVTGVQQSPLAIVVSTLIIAALFTPLRRRVQNAIDRRFYRRKYDAQQVLAQFALTARDETDLDALTSELVRVVQETMQPAHVSVWLRPANTPTRIGVSPQASDA